MPGESARTFGRITLGLAVAAILAAALTVPSVFGIETWKWVLGLIGLALFVSSGKRRGT